MQRLADALNKGKFGLSKRADAARCWSSAPSSFEERLACVKLTDFRHPQARLQQDLERVSEYKRHGIEWSITGDVYDEQFETFRRQFNQTTVAALEAAHERGNVASLSKQIDARLSHK
jgi:hypothetical protein